MTSAVSMPDTKVAAPTLDEAVGVASAILQDSGAPESAAHLVARSLVQAEQMGHASHGLVRVLEYRESAAAGQIVAGEEPAVATRTGSVAVVDGRWGWGHLAADLAARVAGDLAEETGAGFVAVRNCNHSGRLGEWVENLAERNLIGIGLLSCGPAVAPLGGLDRVLGTNPLAIAVPTSDRPVVLDFATAGVAEGKVRVAARAGKQVPPGVLQTGDGEPTTDPDAFYAGGSILPFGAHKGYALSVMIQLLGEALTGGGRPESQRTLMSNGLVLIALSPDPARPVPEFLALVDECRERITSSRPASADRPVLLPGDVEAHTAAAQPDGCVSVAAELWDELLRIRAAGRSAS
jgi:hydroxycarboxylate dehydrogenase B